jgi:hypothetical protein
VSSACGRRFNIGFTALVLALIALWRKLPQYRFWGIITLVALLWSLGANSALYPLLYNLLPGLRFFRGQERAAYLVANSLAILAGMGAAHLLSWDAVQDAFAASRIRSTLNHVFLVVLILAILVFVVWLGAPDDYGNIIGKIAFAALIVGMTTLTFHWLLAAPRPTLAFGLLPLLIVFELFTVNMNAESNYDSIPPTQQLSMIPPVLVAQALADTDVPFRVDGFRGLTDNYGSLYGLADIHGISPLFLQDAYTIIEGDLPDPIAWELFAVRYVFTDWNELPVPSEIIGTGMDRWGGVNLHQLEDPRPFAQVIYDYRTVGEDNVFAELRQLTVDLRQTALIYDHPPTTESELTPIPATVTSFEPERITIQADTPTVGILSIALPNYPGWFATMDSEPIPILELYGALSGVFIPAGEHVVQFIYNPLSYRVGAVLSLFTWVGSGILALALFVIGRMQHVRHQSATGMDRSA